MLAPLETIVSLFRMLIRLRGFGTLTSGDKTLEWLFSAVALASVLARLSVRLTLRQYQYSGLNLWLSDLLLIAGLGCAFGSSACDTLVYRLGALQDFEDPSTYLGQVRFLCCGSRCLLCFLMADNCGGT